MQFNAGLWASDFGVGCRPDIVQRRVIHTSYYTNNNTALINLWSSMRRVVLPTQLYDSRQKTAVTILPLNIRIFTAIRSAAIASWWRRNDIPSIHGYATSLPRERRPINSYNKWVGCVSECTSRSLESTAQDRTTHVYYCVVRLYDAQ